MSQTTTECELARDMKKRILESHICDMEKALKISQDVFKFKTIYKEALSKITDETTRQKFIDDNAEDLNFFKVELQKALKKAITPKKLFDNLGLNDRSLLED